MKPGRQTDRKPGRQKARHSNKETDINRTTDSKAGRQTDRQTCKSFDGVQRPIGFLTRHWEMKSRKALEKLSGRLGEGFELGIMKMALIGW